MAKLRTTDMEWTTIYDGQIMDCLGTPHIKSHMGVYSLHIDMANRVASIPGTGNELMTFTYSYDVARFVQVVLDMPQWAEETFCAGEACTYNDVLKIAEEELGTCRSGLPRFLAFIHHCTNLLIPIATRVQVRRDIRSN